MKTTPSLAALAATRRVQALQGWILALLIALLPLLLPNVLRSKALKPWAPMLLKLIQPHWMMVGFACWGLAAWVAYRSWRGWQNAKRTILDNRPRDAQGRPVSASQLHQSASLLSQELAPLQQQGWTLDYQLAHRSLGTIDLLAKSPRGRLFCVAIKSHRGKVSSDGQSLFRIYDRSSRPFEQDFLAQVKQQAQVLQTERKLATVTPVIAFSDALLELPRNPVRGVYVTQSPKLRALLLSLDRASVDRPNVSPAQRQT